jgi:hypothetical protein
MSSPFFLHSIVQKALTFLFLHSLSSCSSDLRYFVTRMQFLDILQSYFNFIHIKKL